MKIKIPRQQFTVLTVSFWFLLLYIASGFVWWFVSLERQNRQMYLYREEELHIDDPLYADKISALEDARRRKTIQYIGEGSTFLLVIMAGAVFVYRTARRQLRLSTQQQNFMMAVTHELKTPIAVVRLNLETLQKRKLQEEMRNRLIFNTLEECIRLNNLTNNILTAAQLETGHYHLNKVEINISEILVNAIRAFQKRYPSRNVEINIEPEIYIEGENQLIQLLANNFLDNARKYSSPDSTITVFLKSENNIAHIIFTDEGEGIPETEKKKIFDKFYRVGNENTRTSKGTGLGLYLCQKIIIDHHGTINIKNNLPHGTIFTIGLPLYQTPVHHT